jgi:dienelactone hydrolase
MRKIVLSAGCLSLLVIAVIALSVANPSAQDVDARRAELDRLLGRLPESDFFNQWLDRTGEVPPDFDALPSRYYLPDPLRWTRDGVERSVTRAEWPERRKDLAAEVEKWLLGSAPPPPGNVVADILEKTRDRGHEVWKVRLRFGPNHAARLSVTLYLPKDQSRPAPIFLCDGEGYIRWAEQALAGGFGFAAHAARDRDDESFAYADLFGDYDWSSFRRRGWSASRVVDWLVTLPFVDKEHIYIGGHSRSAKAATAGAVFDERIAGLIASSPGSGGGGTPYRYADQSYFGESAELLTRRFPDWAHSRVRFFCGNEDKLPTDSHVLYAMMAPRPLFMSTATEDSVEATWTVEQVYRITQPVYELLGASENLAFRYRPGLHSTDESTSVAFSRFLLAAARGGEAVGDLFPFTPLHEWDYEAWARQQAPRIDTGSFPPAGIDDPTLETDGRMLGREGWNARRADVLGRLQWLLGEGPTFRSEPVAPDSRESEVLARNLARFSVDAAETRGIRLGEGVQGYVYLPGGEGKRPAVVWLAPFQNSRGFIASGYRNATPSPEALVQAGFVAVAFDPIGTGARQAERRPFYDNNPTWSLMGKMVQDARHAVDAALAMPEVDPDRVYLYGYALGGMVAAFAAALDDRVAGAVSVAGFTPMRTDTDGKRTGGVRRFSHLYGWLPRLGAFVGAEERIPVDFHEVLAAVAPRPFLVIAPTLDRHSIPEEVAEAVSRARRAYALMGAEGDLELRAPYDENRLTDAMQEEAIAWLKVRSADHQTAGN